MTGSVIMAFDPSQVTDGAQVTVVTGTQFAVNPPTAAVTPTTSAAGAAATTSTAPPAHDHLDNLTCRRGHRGPVADHVEPRAMGPPGLPVGRHPHRTGGQSHLNSPGTAASGPGRRTVTQGRHREQSALVLARSRRCHHHGIHMGMRGMARRRLRAVAVVGAAVGALAACSASPGAGPRGPSTAATSTPSTPTTSTQAGSGLHPPAVPATGAYLGAWLHPVPTATGGPSFTVEQRNVPAVRAVTGRALGILHVYTPWARPAPVADLGAIAADGSVPLLDWGCAPDGAAVATGADDRRIIAYARALKAYGRPLFLRWCWEMNLVRAHPGVGGPPGFVSAWVHIWDLFHQAGATNVAFVWCPALNGVDPAPYYPGDAYVDWIGVDGYDQDGSTTFAGLFSGFVRLWAGHGKPIMVAETGAPAPDQPAYLQSIARGLPLLPEVKAVVYFDASGPTADWQLAGPGLTAFGALARTPSVDPG